jgi:uncharacterized C2H2 Zn-finger protein
MISCSKCSKNFAYNYLLEKHMNRKKSCSPLDIKNDDNNDCIKTIEQKNIDKQTKNIEKQINDLDKQIIILNKNIITIEEQIELYLKNSLQMLKCEKCNKIFIKKYNIIRHINKNCDHIKELNENKDKLSNDKNKLIDDKNKLIDDKNNILEKKENLQTKLELKELRNAVARMLKKNGQNINIINNTINNKTITNNLTLNINSFGNESLAHITNKDYKKYLTGFFPGFIKFIEKIHFDEKVPENQNICITNLKSKYMYIFENDKWAIKERNELIDKFIAKKYDMLADKCDQLEENNEIDDKVLEKFNRFTQNYQDIEAQKNTKNDIIMMMYRKNLFIYK